MAIVQWVQRKTGGPSTVHSEGVAATWAQTPVTPMAPCREEHKASEEKWRN